MWNQDPKIVAISQLKGIFNAWERQQNISLRFLSSRLTRTKTQFLSQALHPSVTATGCRKTVLEFRDIPCPQQTLPGHGSATDDVQFSKDKKCIRDTDAAFPSIPLSQTDTMMEHNRGLIPTVQIHLQTKCLLTVTVVHCSNRVTLAFHQSQRSIKEFSSVFSLKWRLRLVKLTTQITYQPVCSRTSGWTERAVWVTEYWLLS